MKRAASSALLGALFLALAGSARAHGFDERYDLPVPFAAVVAAACAAVLLSFIAAALFARGASAGVHRVAVVIPLPRTVLLAARGAAWLLWLLTIAAALLGSRDPLMNLAPTLVWIVWWIGLAFASALVGDLWAALDPWRSSFEMLDAAARKLGCARGAALGWRWPAALGMWPAVALLLAWSWLEIIYPLASVPQQLGRAALLWTLVNIGGMVGFGRANWQAHADVFALVFATLGRIAPLRLGVDAQVAWRPVAGQVAFVIALLATVVFDGLHGGTAWTVFEAALGRWLPGRVDVNGFVAGSLGLLGVWLVFLLAYAAAARCSVALLRPRDAALLEARFAITLVPIALAYSVAHNFSSLLIQGQRVFALLSDPFGLQWDLFGTARWYPDIAFVDVRLTWFVAVASIVLGHMASVWWSHRIALAATPSARRAALAMLPLTLLMLAFTATSLLLIGAPMVAG